MELPQASNSGTIAHGATAGALFRANFGAIPGTEDAKSECEKWERLCDTLLVDRERLCAELEKARLDKICKDFALEFTQEMVDSQVDHETTMEQIILEFHPHP
jgi:hypothetical protein